MTPRVPGPVQTTEQGVEKDEEGKNCKAETKLLKKTVAITEGLRECLFRTHQTASRWSSRREGRKAEPSVTQFRTAELGRETELGECGRIIYARILALDLLGWTGSFSIIFEMSFVEILPKHYRDH